tara:strand:+ start:107 stop:754 length:648 start_codon:yes stop_codon:yes gene_type:complete
MEIDEKSIAYAFISEEVQIYLSEEEGYFIASKLICSECEAFWYMNLTECFICGTTNPFLFRCSDCNSFESITKSSGKCNQCSSEELYMVCPNPDCLSNKDNTLKEEANGYGGVFNKNSGLRITQQYCLNCGSKHHRYKNYKIYVRLANTKEVKFEDLKINADYVSDKSYLIIKFKDKGKIKYGLYKIKDLVAEKFELTNLKDRFKDVVNELFPVK